MMKLQVVLDFVSPLDEAVVLVDRVNSRLILSRLVPLISLVPGILIIGSDITRTEDTAEEEKAD